MAQIRIFVGAIGLMAFGYLAWATTQTIANATASGRDISAIQIIQLYSESSFYGIVGLGLLLAAYILTRAAP